MNLKQILVLSLSFLIGAFIFYISGGVALILVFAMLWVDKIIIGKMKTPLEFGIELFSIPAILVGIIYGPITGFIFAVFIIPIIGSTLDFMATAIGSSQLLDVGWAPFVPSIDSFFAGITAVLASFLKNSFPFFYIVLICMLVKVFLNSIRNILSGGPVKLANFINLGLNLFIAFYFQEVFVYLIGV